MRNSKARIYIFAVFNIYKHPKDASKFRKDCVINKKVIYKKNLLDVKSRKVCNKKYFEHIRYLRY